MCYQYNKSQVELHFSGEISKIQQQNYKKSPLFTKLAAATSILGMINSKTKLSQEVAYIA